MTRVAAVYSHPIQYFVPVLRELARRPGIDLTVYFCTMQGVEASLDPGFGRSFKWDIPLLEGYNYRFLRNWRGAARTDGFWRLLNPGIVRELVHHRYDVLLVHGYEHFTKLMAMSTAWLCGTPILLRGDSDALSPRPRMIRVAKHCFLRPLLAGVSACLAIGSRNRMYYRDFGVPAVKIFHAPYCVDNEFWAAKAEKFRGCASRLRVHFGIKSSGPVILCSGKLIGKKQPLLLLEAFEQIRRKYDCALLFAGDGELRPVAEARARAAGIPDVHFAGFLNQTALGSAYAVAAIFVLPSRVEPWGLAVNEAMNFGLPIVVTDRVGCGPDLVRPGVNGYIVPHDCADALADAIERLIEDPAQRHAFGAASRTIIDDWSVDRCVDGIVAAIDAVTGATRR